MICHDLQCIFVHVPRTAGSSIEHALVGEDWWLVDSESKHLSARHARERYPEYWDRYFKFGVVRNPFDWLASLYQAFHAEHGREFRGVIETLLREGTLEVYYPWERVSPLFVDNFEGIDMVLRFEALAEDYERLLKTLVERTGSEARPTRIRLARLLRERVRRTFGRRRYSRWLPIQQRIGLLVGDRELPVSNRTAGKKPYDQYYSPALRELVEEHWRRDLEAYGYGF